MIYRLLCGVALLLVCLAFSGCKPVTEGPADERKNEFFKLGRERAENLDYRGAIEAFEKAVERTPHSALAHFELAVLYEQHSDQKETDYISALYHYMRAAQLRPNEYPAENARQRITACKQELVKAEALAPVAQTLIRDLERLKQDNANLRKQVEIAKAELAAQTAASAAAGSVRTPLPDSFPNRATVRPSVGVGAGPRITPLPPVPVGRAHTVKAGDTLFSISRQYGVKMDKLVAANPGLNPKRVRPGQALTIPAS